MLHKKAKYLETELKINDNT